MRRFPAHCALLVFAAASLGCGNNEAAIAAAKHKQALIEEHQAAEATAQRLIDAARAEPSVESFLAILPYANEATIAITIDGQEVDAHSAVRKLVESDPALFRQAILGHLRSLAEDLPDGDALPADPGEDIAAYLKVVIDHIAERAMQQGTLLSVSVVIPLLDPDGTTRERTIGYLVAGDGLDRGTTLRVRKAELPGLIDRLEALLDEM